MLGGLSVEEGTGEGAVARHRGPHIQVHPLPESRASGPGTVVLGRRLTSLTGRFVALPAHPDSKKLNWCVTRRTLNQTPVIYEQLICCEYATHGNMVYVHGHGCATCHGRRRVTKHCASTVFHFQPFHMQTADISWKKGGTSEFSSDLSSGRRPMSKSDENSEVPPFNHEVYDLTLWIHFS